MSERTESWHLSKSVPVALIATIGLQALFLVWAASQMFATIANNSKRLDRVESQVVTIQTTAQAQAVQLGRIEESVSGTRRIVERIADNMERDR